ncbi:UNVERIFIED_CONTAM: hypothetical protein Sangu_1046800 [Sesamum angustifolium]|uniref:Uncharacterized protein n=1 Tax=Sesamum angustifolium TaxID=2727405 RepID=A0AAW2NZ13_9LAMI
MASAQSLMKMLRSLSMDVSRMHGNLLDPELDFKHTANSKCKASYFCDEGNHSQQQVKV